jgi:hypothetical protein
MLKRTQTVYNFDNWRYSLLTPGRKVYNDKAMSSGSTKTETKPVTSVTETKPVTSESKPVTNVSGGGMDDANKAALKVLQSGDEKAFIKHVFTDQESGRALSYGEMRMRYG